MRPVSRTVRRSTGDSVGAPGLFCVDADTPSCGSEDATPASRACVGVLALLGAVGRAGLRGAFWCASPYLWPFCPPALLGPLRAGPPLLSAVNVFFFFRHCCFLLSLVPPPVVLRLCSFCLLPPPLPLFFFLFGFRPFCFWFLLPPARFGVCLLSHPFPFPLPRPLVVFFLPPTPYPPSLFFCVFFSGLFASHSAWCLFLAARPFPHPPPFFCPLLPFFPLFLSKRGATAP